jgi:hypothetical protein
MKIGEVLTEFDNLQKTKRDILAKKNNDYAKSTDAFSNFQFISQVSDIPVGKTFLQFIAVKLARLMELLNTDKKAKNESIEDTLRDMSNYIDLFYIYRKQYAKKTYSKSKKAEAWE